MICKHEAVKCYPKGYGRAKLVQNIRTEGSVLATVTYGSPSIQVIQEVCFKECTLSLVQIVLFIFYFILFLISVQTLGYVYTYTFCFLILVHY